MINKAKEITCESFFSLLLLKNKNYEERIYT